MAISYLSTDPLVFVVLKHISVNFYRMLVNFFALTILILFLLFIVFLDNVTPFCAYLITYRGEHASYGYTLATRFFALFSVVTKLQ